MSNNTIKTNSIAFLTAIRAAESAGYFTVGSKKYFGDQLVGKRNGQTYRFVLKDTADAVNSLAIGDMDKTNIVEREVALTLEPWHVAVNTNAIEAVTDMDLDKEVAEPNGQKLIQAAVRKALGSDVAKCGTAFVGSGFAPLSQASAHLSSISNEEIYGFVDPNVEAILTSNGQMFVPVSAPDMYSKGLLGKFHGAEYRAQRFIPNVVISKDLADEFAAGVTCSGYSDNGDGTATLTLSNSNNIKKGTPIWIEGVMACDMIGDPTAQEHAFIAVEDSVGGSVKVVAVDNSVNGTRDVASEDGSVAVFESKNASIPEAGKYFGGILRVNGSYEFETLDKIDAAGTDYKKESVMGITVHENKLIDLKTMDNTTRFDMISLAGVVENRGQAYILIR